VKKIILTLLIISTTTGSISAIEMSAGLGGSFIANFSSYKYDGKDIAAKRTIGGGFFALFDATFVEANVGLQFAGMQHGYDGKWDNDSLNLSFLTLGLYGKYPIRLCSFSLFPLLGIQFDFCLSAKQDGEIIFFFFLMRREHFNRLWIKLGAGADFFITEKLYLRPSFLYGINFGTSNDREVKDNNSKESSFHHGLDIRAAIGFRFF
jgi:hypothetical protein